MPCFKNYLSDVSGEYVYYKDNSFTRESYIGILYYDDSAFEIRYYAPENSSMNLPAKDIDLLVSVNPDSDYLELTGEAFLTNFIPDEENTEVVNYLHDILYEFTARRIKAGLISPDNSGYISNKNFSENGIRLSQDFMQFGGKVDLQFDASIPLYNIKNIYDLKGNKVLECVTFGRIASNNDSSFRDFKGFPEKTSFSPVKSSVKEKTKKVTFENQSISLYSDWENPMENLWTYGDDAILTMNTIPFFFENSNMQKTYILRTFLLSYAGAYVNLSETELIAYPKKSQMKIFLQNWQPDVQKQVVNNIILTDDVINACSSYMSLTVYKKPFQENRSYYEKILKSYSVKN